MFERPSVRTVRRQTLQMRQRWVCRGRSLRLGVPALAQQAPEYQESQLRNEPILTVEAIHRLATAGDHLAIRLWNRATHVWGTAAVNLIHAYDPKRLIVSGGITSSGESLLAPLRSYVEKHRWRGAGSVQIV